MAAPVPVAVLGRRFVVPAAVPPAVVAGAAAATCALVGLVDPTSARLLPPCPFRAVTGLDCPGCGSTRALHHLLNGRPVTAAGFNVVFVAALPLLVWLWLAWAAPTVTGRRRRNGGPDGAEGRRHRLSPAVVLGVVGLLLVFGVVRNLPFEPFRALGTD